MLFKYIVCMQYDHLVATIVLAVFYRALLSDIQHLNNVGLCANLLCHLILLSIST